MPCDPESSPYYYYQTKSHRQKKTPIRHDISKAQIDLPETKNKGVSTELIKKRRFQW